MRHLKFVVNCALFSLHRCFAKNLRARAVSLADIVASAPRKYTTLIEFPRPRKSWNRHGNKILDSGCVCNSLVHPAKQGIISN